MNPERLEGFRNEIIKRKDGAVWVAFEELEDLINKTAVSKQYFNRSQSWFAQRLNGCTVMNKAQSFKPDEYSKLAEAFRDIAKRLIAHAEEIEQAKIDDDCTEE